jgi:hypothetical protein
MKGSGMAHNADSRNERGEDEKSVRYVIGYGIDTVVGGAGDRVIVCGRDDSETAFLVEDGATYTARTGSAAADGEILVSADGALIMSLSNIEEITIRAAGPGDSLTVAGDFSATMLGADGLSFEGAGGIVDASAVTSGHRVRVGAATCGGGERRRRRHEGDEAAYAGDLLIFRTVAGAADEPGPGETISVVGHSHAARLAGDLVMLIEMPGRALTRDDGRSVDPADPEGREC